MKINLLHHTLFLLTFALVIASCKHEPIIPDPPEPEPTFCEQTSPTYSDSIKVIVELSCSYTGCHAAGAGIGDFTTYSGMLSRLDNGKIEERVIDMEEDTTLGMPPFYASGPVDLTDEQLALFKCWLDNGYPEQ